MNRAGIWLGCATGFALAVGVACAGGSDPAVDVPTDAPVDAPTDAPSDGIVIVPVQDDGNAHFCCEYTEGGKTMFALLPAARACLHRFGDRGGRWVEGPQCLPCCCEIPLSAADPSLGVRRELTVPGQCAGSGQCVTASAPECQLAPVRPRPGGGPPKPGDGREVITPTPKPGEGKRGKGG